MEGSIKEIKELDKILSKSCDLVKDSSNKGSKAYTKVYQVNGNPLHKSIRLFFDEREKRGTIKIKDHYPLLVGIATFTLIQAGILVQQSVQSIASLI